LANAALPVEGECKPMANKRRTNRPHYDPSKKAPTSQRQPKALATTAPPPIRGPPGLTLLSRKEVLAKVGLTFPTIWKWMMQGKFPRSRDLGKRKSAWIEAEVDEWIMQRPIRRLKSDAEAA
jgi:predicted DNA-binding transcriptional regulator AlpA